MFLDKSERFNNNLTQQKGYYEGDENINVIDAFNNLNNKKGGFISKLGKNNTFISEFK